MENSIFPKNKFSVNAQHRRMNSLRTDDISPPRKPIVKPYEYGEGFEELKPKGIAKEDPQKIMNFCLKTNDIQGASPKKIIHVSNTRDLLATEDIDGCQPDPFRNRERTKRFNMKIRKLNRGKNKSVVNGKYSLQSEYSEEDHNKKFAYANHADEGSLKTGKSYILPKYTKEIAKYGKRYYENKNKNGSNIDFSWRDEYYEDEGEGEEFESPKHYFEDNNDYGKILGTSQKSIAPLADQNTPLRRQESQNRELNTILKDDGMNNSQVQMDSINPMNEVENNQQTVVPQNEGRIRNTDSPTKAVKFDNSIQQAKLNNSAVLSVDHGNSRGQLRNMSPGLEGSQLRHMSPGVGQIQPQMAVPNPRSYSNLARNAKPSMENLGYPATDSENIDYYSIRERGLSSSLNVGHPSNSLNPIHQHSITNIARSPQIPKERKLPRRSSSQLQKILNNQRNSNSIENVNLNGSLKPGWSPQRRRNADLVDALQSARKRYEIQQNVARENYNPELYGDHKRKHIITKQKL